MPSAKASKAKPKPKVESELKLFSRFEEEPLPIPKICILDTNVFLGAILEKEDSDWDDNQINCSVNCARIMDYINRGIIGKIVLDDGIEIYEEYCNKPDRYKVNEIIFNTLLVQCRIEFRTIKKDKSKYGYKEFPRDPGLDDFDESDRKFVAVANAGDHVPILQSMDGKWWRWAAPLHKPEIGIEVLFTNPDIAKQTCSEKNNNCDKNCSNCQKLNNQ